MDRPETRISICNGPAGRIDGPACHVIVPYQMDWLKKQISIYNRPAGHWINMDVHLKQTSLSLYCTISNVLARNIDFYLQWLAREIDFHLQWTSQSLYQYGLSSQTDRPVIVLYHIKCTSQKYKFPSAMDWLEKWISIYNGPASHRINMDCHLKQSGWSLYCIISNVPEGNIDFHLQWTGQRNGFLSTTDQPVIVSIWISISNGPAGHCIVPYQMDWPEI